MDSETERSGSARTFEESEAGPAGARITPRSLSVPGHWTDVIDVLFDDRRVFSINPAELERSRGRARSPWPPSLRGYLNGEATVTLRSHLSREVLAEERVRFGPSGDAVRIEDQQGVPLSLDKWGALVAVFDEDTPVEILRRVRPHIWVKGGDYAGVDVPEAAVLEQWGGQVVTLSYLAGRSTTSLASAAAGSSPVPAIHEIEEMH